MISSDFPLISNSQIRNWVGTPSFGRGESYFHGGAIESPRIQGMHIKATCQGSQAKPYRVEVVFDSEGIAFAECSCPDGGGGRCKHVAALLLTWKDAPEAFERQQPVDEILETFSKADLIVLVKRMLKQDPDLEDLLALPPLGSSAKPLNEKQFLRQVMKALSGRSGEWNEAYEVVGGLKALRELAESYKDADEYANAETAYRILIETSLDFYNNFIDEAGTIGAVLEACIDALGVCLKFDADPARRAMILQTLFDCAVWDMHQGGVEVGDTGMVAILEYALPTEKILVAGWVRAELPKADGDRERESLGRMLLDLEDDRMDDETYLRICRETGRIHDLIERLLEHSRSDEAEVEAAAASDDNLLGLADLFLAHNRVEAAEHLIEARIPITKDSRLKEWMKVFLVKNGRSEEALPLAETLFWERPEIEGYKAVREIALPLAAWDQHRAPILERLAGQGCFALLTEIYISEVDMYIGQRDRESYVTAARFLVQVKNLYQKLGEFEHWDMLIVRIQDEYRRLPALIDELKSAGLTLKPNIDLISPRGSSVDVLIFYIGL